MILHILFLLLVNYHLQVECKLFIGDCTFGYCPQTCTRISRDIMECGCKYGYMLGTDGRNCEKIQDDTTSSGEDEDKEKSKNCDNEDGDCDDVIGEVSGEGSGEEVASIVTSLPINERIKPSSSLNEMAISVAHTPLGSTVKIKLTSSINELYKNTLINVTIRMSANATHRLMSSYKGITNLITSPSLTKSLDTNQYSKSIISDSLPYLLKARSINKSLNSSVAFAQKASNVVSLQNYVKTSLYQELVTTVSVLQSNTIISKSLAKSMIIGETRSTYVSTTAAAYKNIDRVTEIPNVLSRQHITEHFKVTSSIQATNFINITSSSMRTPIVKNIINSSNSINLIYFVNNTSNAKVQKSIDIYNTTSETHSIKVISSSNISKYISLPESNSDTRSATTYVLSTRRMNTVDRSASRMDTVDKSTGRMDTVDRSTSRMDIVDRSSSRMNTTDRSTSMMNTLDRSTSIMDTVDRSTSMMGTVDRSTSIMDTVDSSTSKMYTIGGSTSRMDTVDKLEHSTAVVNKINTELIHSFTTHQLMTSQIQLSSKNEMKISYIHSENTEIVNTYAGYNFSVSPTQGQITSLNQVKSTSPSKVKVALSAKRNMTSPLQVSFTSQKATGTGELRTMDAVTPRIPNINTSKQYKTSIVSFSEELSTSEFQQGVSSSSKRFIVSIAISKDIKKGLTKSTSCVTLVSKSNTQSFIQASRNTPNKWILTTVQPVSYFASGSSNVLTNTINSRNGHITNSRKGHITVENSLAASTSYSSTSTSSYLQSKSVRETDVYRNTNLEENSSTMAKRNSIALLQRLISSSNIQNLSLYYASIKSSQVSAIYSLNASQKTSNLQKLSKLDKKPSTERSYRVTQVIKVTRSDFDTLTSTGANKNFTLLDIVHNDFIDINEDSSSYSHNKDRENYFYNMPNPSRRMPRPVSSLKTVITTEVNSSSAVCLQINICKVVVISFFAYYNFFM